MLGAEGCRARAGVRENSETLKFPRKILTWPEKVCSGN